MVTAQIILIIYFHLLAVALGIAHESLNLPLLFVQAIIFVLPAGSLWSANGLDSENPWFGRRQFHLSMW